MEIFNRALEPFDNLVAYFMRLTDLPVDQVTLLIIFIVSLPMGTFYRFIESANLRNLYAFLPGLIFQLLMYRMTMWVVMFNSLLVYVLAITLRKNCGNIIGVASIIILSLVHIHRTWTDYGGWRIDVSVCLMMITCKYFYFGYEIHDGKLEKIPSLLEFLGYVYFYPSASIGPTFDFTTYQNFIYKRKHYAAIPGTFVPALIDFFTGLVFVLPVIFLGNKMDVKIFGSPEIEKYNILEKFLMLNTFPFVSRCRYYAAWILSSSAIQASGLGYNGLKDGRAKFDSVTTMDLRFEYDPNFKNKIDYWNKSVQAWLKNCVYMRIYNNDPKKANVATYVTFLVSAFWHGFYISYYIFFLHWAVVSGLAKFVYKARHKFARFEGKLFSLFLFILSTTLMNYMGITFLLLEWNKVIYYFGQTYYLGTILIVGSYAFFATTGWGQKDPNARSKNAEKKKAD